MLAYCFTRSVPHSTITGCAEKTGGNYFFCKLLAVSMYFWMSSSKLVVHSTGESGEENNELFSLIVPLLSKSIFFTRLRQRFSENLGSAWKRVGCDNAEEGQRGGDHRVHHALVKVFEAKLGIPLSRHFLFFLFPFSFQLMRTLYSRAKSIVSSFVISHHHRWLGTPASPARRFPPHIIQILNTLVHKLFAEAFVICDR